MVDESHKFTVKQRFLEYVKYDTRSDDAAESIPSTKKQLRLINTIARQLRDMGLDDITVSDYGMLTATLPKNTDRDVPVIGLFAHVDTSPDVTGTNVKPIVHENYQGGDIHLPGDASQVISVEQNPELNDMIGEEIITSDGTTLLGADNKAGVAEIMEAIAYFITHPEVKRGTVKVAFTVDEETGNGIRHFDIESFGAQYGYTMDGGVRGEIETESFCADSVKINFLGKNVHPGYAKGKMINSIKIATLFLESLPKDHLSPETTEDREGYVHCGSIEGVEELTTLKFIIRDFEKEKLQEYENILKEKAQHAVDAFPGAQMEFEVSETYKNMRYVLDEHPKVKELAERAIKAVGLTPFSKPIRGGTDGSQLSYMGLPTANLFAGEHNFHSKREFTSVQEMELAAKTIIELVQIWEQEG